MLDKRQETTDSRQQIIPDAMVSLLSGRYATQTLLQTHSVG